MRLTNGWVNIHNEGDDFETFLIKQESIMRNLMKKLGFRYICYDASFC